MINQPERVDLKHDSVHPPTGPRSYLMHSPITCVSPMRVRSLAALTKARESLASAHRARAAGEDLSSRAHTQTVSCGAVGGDASNGSQAANSSSNLGTLASLRHRRHWPPPARLRMPCLGQRGRGVRRHSSHFFFRILCLQNPVAVATQGSRRHHLLFTPYSHMCMYMCMYMHAHVHAHVLAAPVAAALAEEVVLQGIGADAGGDAARPAAAQAVPALGPHPAIGEAAWVLGEARRQKKTRLNRQVEVCCVSCLALVLWKNHSAE